MLKPRNQSNGPRDPPYSPSTAHRPREPPETPSSTPGLSKPRLVRTESAPPRVFSPKSGLEPGMMSTGEMANWGMRSQLIVSPNPSLKRMPSRYTDNPMGLPVSGPPRKPRYVRSLCQGLPWAPMVFTEPKLRNRCSGRFTRFWSLMSSVVTRCALPGYLSSGTPRDGIGVVPMTRTGGSCMTSGGFGSGAGVWGGGGFASGAGVCGGCGSGGCGSRVSDGVGGWADTDEPTRGRNNAAQHNTQRTGTQK